MKVQNNLDDILLFLQDILLLAACLSVACETNKLAHFFSCFKYIKPRLKKMWILLFNKRALTSL